MYKYSDEKNSRKIAKAISNSRPLKSTEDFSKVLKDVVEAESKIYKSDNKKMFSSNKNLCKYELEEITLSINKIKNFIKPGGVIVCLTITLLKQNS